jgi:dTDP-4-amino-4,6-dideoxygalactose transaminase
MEILKTASEQDKYLRHDYYYDSAREGMSDLFRNMVAEGLVDTVFLPGYIGWSPNEGSGIFDPLSDLDGLAIRYYKMTRDLRINLCDLAEKIEGCGARGFAVLVVNYFGFVDPDIRAVSDVIRKHSGWIVEDNAHGFFTYQCSEEVFSDATFFSLHKMFPFKGGGSLTVSGDRLKALDYRGALQSGLDRDPWQYDIGGIARARRRNYKALGALVDAQGIAEFFVPLKPTGLPVGTVPQTFPILIAKGDRNQIYELMNGAGYGVVSLYHTLIEPLRIPEFDTSLALSRSILNLPVHQDVDPAKYLEMVTLLVELCRATGEP